MKRVAQVRRVFTTLYAAALEVGVDLYTSTSNGLGPGRLGIFDPETLLRLSQPCDDMIIIEKNIVSPPHAQSNADQIRVFFVSTLTLKGSTHLIYDKLFYFILERKVVFDGSKSLQNVYNTPR